MNFIVAPNFSSLGNIAGFGGVNAGQNTDTFAMFRVLPDGNVDAILPEYGRGVDFTWTVGRGIFVRGILNFAFRRVAIKPPDLFQKHTVFVFFTTVFRTRYNGYNRLAGTFLWLRVERVADSVAAAE